MRIPRRRLRLLMTEKLADDWQAQASSRADRSECMPKVMQTQIAELSAALYRLPGLLQVGAWSVRGRTSDDVNACARKTLQNLNRCRAEHERLATGFAVTQKCQAALEINLLPAQGEDLT